MFVSVYNLYIFFFLFVFYTLGDIVSRPADVSHEITPHVTTCIYIKAEREKRPVNASKGVELFFFFPVNEQSKDWET